MIDLPLNRFEVLESKSTKRDRVTMSMSLDHWIFVKSDCDVCLRDLQKDTIVLQDRPSDHAMCHARQVAVRLLAADKLKSQGQCQLKRKQVEADLQFIQGPDVSSQGHDAVVDGQGQLSVFHEVTPPESDKWAGLDLIPQNLESRIPGLLGSELSQYGLGIKNHGSIGRGLVTLRLACKSCRGF